MLSVREATTEADRESVFRLRYEVYVKEIGWPQAYADHARMRVEEPFDSAGGHLFLAVEDGNPVGTVRVNLLREGPLECQEFYDLERFTPYYPDAISMTTKLMVKKSHRGAAASWQLVTAAYRFARENRVFADFIDTRPHLVRMYQRLGYRFYKANITNPDHGSVIPMVFLCGDLPHMEIVGSPFVELARKYPIDQEATPFFQWAFRTYASIVPTWAMGEEEVWRRYAEYAGFDTARRSGFLQDLTESEIRELLGHFDSVEYARGDVVMREGDASLGMFCLVEGQAEVRTGPPDRDYIVDLLHAGDVFGEMGFIARTRRSATIVIREPSRVLVLSEPEFRKFASSQPDLALKLLIRLFTIVVERFHFRISSAQQSSPPRS